MTRRTVLIISLLALSLCGLLAGTCGTLAYLSLHKGDGPKHRFPLAGSDPLSDEQALSYSRQAMELDGRYKPSLRLTVFGSAASGTATPVGRGEDRRSTSVYWYDSLTQKGWYVYLRRVDGAVTGYTHASP